MVITGGAEVDGALGALRRAFGYRDFRGAQRRIIDHVIGGGDALVLMPTGGGKSLCYQIPALVRGGVGVVISPLIVWGANPWFGWLPASNLVERFGRIWVVDALGKPS